VRLLDALGANLAAEQKELARQDFVLFRQLLTPIQVCPVPWQAPGCQSPVLDHTSMHTQLFPDSVTHRADTDVLMSRRPASW
jgi:hypothetical protein